MQDKEKQEKLLNILERVSAVTGVPTSKIQGLSREASVVDARQAYCCAAYYSGETYEDVGKYINRHYSSVIHLCNDKPLSEKCLSYIEEIRSDSIIVDKIKELALKVHQNPRDEKSKQQLKLLL